MNRYFVALGSNLGDRLSHLTGACREIAEFATVDAVSSIYETEPVGGPEQGPFLNAVVGVSSELAPIELLERLQTVEDAHGREREVRWGPRTLDLDIVAWDGEPVTDSRLEVPHPRAAERAFVLMPLADVAPGARMGAGLSAADALAGVDRSGVDRLARSWLPQPPTGPATALVTGQMLLIAGVAIAIMLSGDMPGLTLQAVLGSLLAVSGLALGTISGRRLGPALTPSPIPTADATLVESGPYGLVRHPIYGGLVMFSVGSSIVFSSLPALVISLVLAVYLWFKSAYEERQLRLRFAGYRAYMSRVPRRLIPFVT